MSNQIHLEKDLVKEDQTDIKEYPNVQCYKDINKEKLIEDINNIEGFQTRSFKA